jgi:2-(1,2-epoxy-1,2-dihydrophenyl)acetyl-CoA isomerase
MAASEPVLLTRDGPVATLTLNRPEALNALDDAMVEALVALTSEVAGDDAVHVLVVRGAGKHFMAGGDIRLFAQSLERDGAARARDFQHLADRIHAAIETLARMPQPVIACVRGAAAGFGLSLMNACDLVFAADDAYFASAYLTLGVSPDGGGTYWLPRIVGSRKAAEIMLLGERLDAPAALALGLVNRILPGAELDAAVDAVARRLAAGPQRAIHGAKRLLRQSSAASLAEQLAAEAASFGACAGTEDFAEGVRAFLGKRPPRFGGA